MRKNQYGNKVLISERDNFIDIVKSLGIILVVIGHCIQYGSGELYFKKELYFDNALFKYIYSFHMPLFMLISGYLFGYNKNMGLSLIKKKALQMVIPIFVWSILPLVASIYGSFNEGLGFLVIIKKYISISVHNLWFLWAVFLLSCIVVVIHTFYQDNTMLYMILWILSNFISDELNVFLYTYMYPFFVLGYLYNTRGWKCKVIKWSNSYYSIILLGIVFAILLSFFSYDKYIYI